jgi:hypothetical protein
VVPRISFVDGARAISKFVNLVDFLIENWRDIKVLKNHFFILLVYNHIKDEYVKLNQFHITSIVFEDFKESSKNLWKNQEFAISIIKIEYKALFIFTYIRNTYYV